MRRRLGFTLAAMLLAVPMTAKAGEVEIVNIRVGQGDATLIRGPADATGKRVTVLFDAGDIADYVPWSSGPQQQG